MDLKTKIMALIEEGWDRNRPPGGVGTTDSATIYTRLLGEGVDVPPGAMARILEELSAEGQITGAQALDTEDKQLHGARAIIEPEWRLWRAPGETKAVVEESVRKMSEKALGMLNHMRRQIFVRPAPYVEVRGAAVSIGVNPGGSECDDLVDELLQAGYIRTYPSPSLTAHGLYRMTDQGIAAAREAAAEEG